MIAFYFALSWLLWALCALPLFILSFTSKKHAQSFKARFFLYKNSRQAKASVHFHACSFGEVRAIEPLVAKFNSRISVITQTGYEAAQKLCKSVNFLAFENFMPFWLTPCKVLVVFEAELWLMLFYVAKFKGAKTLLINARISERSFSKYQKFAFLYKKIFSYVDEIYAQSEADKARLEILGAKNISVVGNIKVSGNISANKAYKKPNSRLIIFASTHDGEENLLLSNFSLPKGQKLIIAPRHPERFSEVCELASEYARTNALKFARFSELNLEDLNLERELSADILVLDTLGELVNFYAICDIAVLCGSFIKGIGGHNPVEIAHFNKPIISGAFIHNQKALFANVCGVRFCEDLSEFNALVRSHKEATSLKNSVDLSPILQSIERGLNAG